MSSSYTYPLPKVSITASQVGTRIPVSIGGSFQQSVWIEVSNESPYILSIFSGQGILLDQLQPQLVDIVQIPSGDNFFIIVPILLLPQASPSSEVDINVYPFGKPEGAYPIPLGRQAAPISSTAINSYGQNARLGTGAANFAVFNVFNLANSGVIYTFFEATLEFESGTTSVDCNINIFRGADLNLAGNAGTPNANDASSPTSTAHCTFASAIASPSITSEPSFHVALAGQTNLLIRFPDQVIVHPGDNCYMLATNNNNVYIMQMKWTER